MTERVVIITGAKGGLGTFVTQRFLEAGDTVVGVSRSIKQSDFAGARFVAMPADFSSGKAIQELAAQVIQRFGKIDVLVHVLGGFAGGQAVADTDDATWAQMRDLNLNSGFYIARAVIPHMRKAGSGRIIAVGSLTAVEPHANLGAYVTFKAALVTLMQTVALENADANITANTVLPGTMDTPGNRASDPKADFSKWVQPADVASLIFWLASSQAAQVSGVAIPVRS